ncbi:hypothetical protein RB195_005957 [Necator americanus]|uniref:Uncharacterized protein n=1 Tax=Necator americanus TaxID=51031 RepID=A0ABR1BQC5_NECAM
MRYLGSLLDNGLSILLADSRDIAAAPMPVPIQWSATEEERPNGIGGASISTCPPDRRSRGVTFICQEFMSEIAGSCRIVPLKRHYNITFEQLM